MGKYPDEQAFADLERHPENLQIPGLIILRPDVFLFYANATPLHEEIRLLVADGEPSPKVVLLDLEASKDLDVTTLDMLAEVQRELREGGIELWVSRLHHTAVDRFAASGLAEQIGEANLYPSVRQAVRAYLKANPEVEFEP